MKCFQGLTTCFVSILPFGICLHLTSNLLPPLVDLTYQQICEPPSRSGINKMCIGFTRWDAQWHDTRCKNVRKQSPESLFGPFLCFGSNFQSDGVPVKIQSLWGSRASPCQIFGKSCHRSLSSINLIQSQFRDGCTKK